MKKCFEFLKNPPKIAYGFTFLLTLCLIALDFVCLFLWRDFVFVYAIYAISAIFLGYAIYLFVRICSHIKQKFVELFEKNKHTKRFLEDKNFRKSVFAVCGDVVNIAYLVLLSVSAVISHSVWIALLAGYYFLLILTKTVLLFGGLKIVRGKVESKQQKALKIYRNTGIYLVIMAILMSGMIVQMITMEAEIAYKDLFVYVVATYTFFKVILTIVNVVRECHNQNFVIKAIINISTVTAIISLYSLQIGMIKTFGGSNLQTLNKISGICVGLAILGLGIFMIIKGQRKLLDLKKEQNQENITQIENDKIQNNLNEKGEENGQKI